MSRFNFKYVSESNYSNEEKWEPQKEEDVVTHSFSTEDLYEVVQRMEQFLKGAGFVFSGTLEIVPSEAENSEEWYVSDTNIPWPFPESKADTNENDEDPT